MGLVRSCNGYGVFRRCPVYGHQGSLLCVCFGNFVVGCDVPYEAVQAIIIRLRLLQEVAATEVI